MGFIPSDLPELLTKKTRIKSCYKQFHREGGITPDLHCELSCNHCHDWIFKTIVTSQWISEHIKCSRSWEGWKEGVLPEDLPDQLTSELWVMLPLALMRYNNFLPVDFRTLSNPGLKWEVLLPGNNFENRVQEDSKWVTAKPSGSSGNSEEHNFDIRIWATERIQFLFFWSILKYWSPPVHLMVCLCSSTHKN